MKVLADKGVVLCGCVLMWRADAVTVVWLLLAVTISGLAVVAEHWRWFAAVPAAYLLAAALAVAPAVGAPLVVYDLARASTGRPPWLRLAAAAVCAPITAVMVVGGEPASAYTAALGAVAALLALRTRQGEATRQNLNAARDDLRERVLALQNANTRMLQMQDDELRAAALSERTRIAREIHDGVGHLLTRLLLQIKALQITHRGKPGVVADLAALSDGLDEALDSMRCSVHTLSELRGGPGCRPQPAGLAERHRQSGGGLLAGGGASARGFTLCHGRRARSPHQRGAPRRCGLSAGHRDRLPRFLAGHGRQ